MITNNLTGRAFAMLDTQVFEKLKQVDISKDHEKTSQRVKELWFTIGADVRNAILRLSGITKFTVARTYKNGNISAALACAMAKVLEIDPKYFTGEIDVKTPCKEARIIDFLKSLGYGHLFGEAAPVKQNRTKRQKSKPDIAAESTVPEKAQQAELEAAPTPDQESTQLTEQKDENIEEPVQSAVDDTHTALSNPVVLESVEPTLTCIIDFAKSTVDKLGDSEKSFINGMDEQGVNLLVQGLFLKAQFNSNNKALLDFVKLALMQ